LPGLPRRLHSDLDLFPGKEETDTASDYSFLGVFQRQDGVPVRKAGVPLGILAEGSFDVHHQPLQSFVLADFLGACSFFLDDLGLLICFVRAEKGTSGRAMQLFLPEAAAAKGAKG
jgi:hypothetical protein